MSAGFKGLVLGTKRAFCRTREAEALRDQIARLAWTRGLDPTVFRLTIDRLLRRLDRLCPLEMERVSDHGDPLEQVKQILGPEDAVIYLVNGLEKTRAFVVTANGFNHDEIGPRQEVKADARSLAKFMKQRGKKYSNSEDRLALAMGTRLSKALALPKHTKRLLVIAGGDLVQIPFPALIWPETGERWLSRFEIVGLPSLESYLQLKRGSTTVEGLDRILIFANPTIPKNYHLPPLPQGSTEGKAISSMFKGHAKLLIGAEATPSAFREEIEGDWDVLHMATHGILFPGRGELSSLALTPDQSGSGLITGVDIGLLQKTPPLVVLSACETALGSNIPGEGMIGLPRAFFQSGTLGVVVSRWKVEDKSTRILMEQFYKNILERKMAPSAALRQAQLMFASKWEPYYWAGFFYTGDPDLFFSERKAP